MRKVQKEIFVTKDGSEFINENEAARHERRGQALADIEYWLFNVPDLSGPRENSGDDAVDDILTYLSDEMVNRPASVKLLEILRQLEEGAPAADPGPKKPGVKIKAPRSGGE